MGVGEDRGGDKNVRVHGDGNPFILTVEFYNFVIIMLKSKLTFLIFKVYEQRETPLLLLPQP
jgi:hypothetical protein